MRKIAANLFSSLDGIVEAPETWTGPYFGPEIGQIIQSSMAGADTLLLGRATYETFAESFSGNTGDPMAAYLNEVRKVVVSTTLDTAAWNNSTLISDDVTAQIAALKRQPGKDIAVNGSITLVRSLLREGLLDELCLLVFPVVLGGGQRLFADDGDSFGLKLTTSDALPAGVLHLVYEPA